MTRTRPRTSCRTSWPRRTHAGGRSYSDGAVLISWEPVAGLPVTVLAYNRSEQDVISLAERLRLDQVSRCQVNFEVVSVPASTTLDQCFVTYANSGVAPGGMLKYSRPGGSHLEVQRNPAVANPPQLPDATPVTVNGWPGFWRAGDARQASGADGQWLTVYAPGGVVKVFISGTFTQHDAEQLVTTLRFL